MLNWWHGTRSSRSPCSPCRLLIACTNTLCTHIWSIGLTYSCKLDSYWLWCGWRHQIGPLFGVCWYTIPRVWQIMKLGRAPIGSGVMTSSKGFHIWGLLVNTWHVLCNVSWLKECMAQVPDSFWVGLVFTSTLLLFSGVLYSMCQIAVQGSLCYHFCGCSWTLILKSS